MLDLTNYSSINAVNQKDGLSGRYSYIPTTQVVDVLAKDNWLPVKAEEVHVRNQDHLGFQKHLIRFRNNDLAKIGDIFPEIVLTNSHNGLASFRLMAGLFRLICSNGLVIADSTFSSHKITHKGYTDQAVRLAIEDVTDNIPKITNKVNDFKEIELTKDEQGAYALASLTIKYGKDEVSKRDFLVDRLLTAYRGEDQAPTLWNTYNKVQEKLVKGAYFERHPKKTYRVKKNRGINNISENIRVNQGLWLLAEKMAEIKAN